MSDRLLVATRKGLFTVRRAASDGAWRIAESAFVADPVYIVMHDPRDDSYYAALKHGHFGVKLHRCQGDGTSWQECKVPEYPKPPEGTVDKCSMSGVTIPWKTDLIWALSVGGVDEPGALWCGTVPGGLFRSDDRGDSWHLVRSLWDDPLRKAWFGGGLDYPGIHSICVNPTNSAHVTVGVSCGGVWQTHDRGETWACTAEGMHAAYMPPDQQRWPHVQDPHAMAMCPADPNVLWVQHHNGVFRSTDGAASWLELTAAKPSNFGFAVAAHPHDPQTAWFVPAVKDECRVPVDGKVVVSRTRDGGATFDVLRDGLPQTHAYDLTFRHALDVDETGDRLAFGSTTGSLWISENGGDSWLGVSNHLPPVYCVRFVKG